MEKMSVKHKKTKGSRKHGFLSRSSTKNGRKVLQRRRSKSRKRLTK